MKQFTHDLYAPLSHIPAIGNGLTRPSNTHPVLKTWLTDEDARRLLAYQVLAAFRDNVRRYYLPKDMWLDPDRVDVDEISGRLRDTGSGAPGAKWRELGHASRLVSAARSLILGDSQRWVFPELVAAQADPENAAEGVDVPRLEALEAWLEDWCDRERFVGKLFEDEGNCSGLGDGVMLLSWSTAKKRPKLEVYDPGFYFPDLRARVDGWDDPDFPPVVHLAWEWEEGEGAQRKVWVERHTWEMRPLPRPVDALWGGTREWTCYYRADRWETKKLRGAHSVYNLGQVRGGQVLVEEQDLGLDFIPIIHQPHDEAGSRHWGAATILMLTQVLDDIAGADTDLAISSELAAGATVVTTGAGGGDLPAGPGAEWNMGDGGASLLDTSKVLDANLKHKHQLLEDLSVNGRLPGAQLGRVQPDEVPSGYALALGFAPATEFRREARAAREPRRRLIAKFALRMAQAYGVLEAGPTPRITLQMGTSLAADVAVAIAAVKDLLPVHAISTATAVRMLQAAGLPVEDAEAEVAAIEAEDLAGTVSLVEATGDVQAARKRAGLEGPGPALPTPTQDPEDGPDDVPSGDGA